LLSFVLAGWFFLKKFFKKIFKWKFNVFISLIILLAVANIFLNFETTKKETALAKEVITKEPNNSNGNDYFKIYFNTTKENFEKTANKIISDQKIKQLKKESITKEEFINIVLTKPNNTTIYDTRDKIEYETGHIAGSELLLIDEKDLKYFIENNKNKKLIFYCRKGQRSAAIAEILSIYGLDTHYVEQGIMFFDDNLWDGDYYDYNNFKTKLLSQKEFKTNLDNGITGLDPRNLDKYKENKLNLTINIPINEWGYSKTVNFFEENLKDEGSFMGICYDKISCFKIKIILNTLEKDYKKNIVGIYYVKK